jgi:dTDP-glucose 4,6-dehydratase
MRDTILVTGGAGFIGSNFIRSWLLSENARVVNLDQLTYAGNIANLESVRNHEKYCFVLGNICDQKLVRDIFATHSPRALLHFAAESHVDRSIIGPAAFISTNIEGTFNLLEESKAYFETLRDHEKLQFRFLHVSTDEVHGSLGPDDPPFSEQTPYAPNSPYSASKASADHLVRAYHHTYGLPTLTVNCSNNYGPFQFPEKLIPLMIVNALKGDPLPLYGDGRNRRDWLYVIDHCDAIRKVLAKGRPGEKYNIGGEQEKSNIEVVNTICAILEELRPSHIRYASLIQCVKDRPGHDRRYAMDISKIRRELGWTPGETFESGLWKTVEWYLANPEWIANVTSGAYREWIKMQYQSVR